MAKKSTEEIFDTAIKVTNELASAIAMGLHTGLDKRADPRTRRIDLDALLYRITVTENILSELKSLAQDQLQKLPSEPHG